jgi:OOP family OmpA-OmpF porin
MRHRVLLAACAAAAFVPTRLTAQQAPEPHRSASAPAQPAPRPLLPQYAGEHREESWEVTVGAGALIVDRQFGTKRVLPGGTFRLGYHVSPTWGVSVGAGFGFASIPSVTLIQPVAAVTWTPNINAGTSPFITAGLGGTYAAYSGYHFTAEYGVQVGAGIRTMIARQWALRLEVREQFEHFQEFTRAVYNGTATAGLSYFLGGGPLKDGDGDGVPDRYDRCPRTPLGALVDTRGCPTDRDGDGVPDGIDRCPGTAAGLRVDATGCPVDSDHDGVPDYQDRCPDTPPGVGVDVAGCPKDADGDGVADYRDRCPNTPQGAPVDAAGCPKDSDGDGVFDYLDRCPDTPHGVAVDAAGCPADSDHDGVPDYQDRCPGSPPGTQVDIQGCPVERDSDGDGVPDAHDACPETPQGTVVYTGGPYAGCRTHELPVVGRSEVLAGVSFGVVRGHQELTPAAQMELDTIAESLKAAPAATWEIGAYTRSGASARLTHLSEQQATLVKDYLVTRGVAANSLTAVGYGPRYPRASNRTARGRAANDRIEIKRLQ